MLDSNDYLKEDDIEIFFEEMRKILFGEKIWRFFTQQNENLDDQLLNNILKEGLEELTQESALDRVNRLKQIIISVESWYIKAVSLFMKRYARKRGILDIQKWMKSQKQEFWLISELQGQFTYLKMLEDDYCTMGVKFKKLLEKEDQDGRWYNIATNKNVSWWNKGLYESHVCNYGKSKIV